TAGGTRVQLRNDDVLGEAAINIHSKNACVDAYMALAAQALHAPTADDVRFARNKVANVVIGDVFAKLYDRAAKFVADYARRDDARRRPRIPVINVQIGAADRCRFELDLDHSATG